MALSAHLPFILLLACGCLLTATTAKQMFDIPFKSCSRGGRAPQAVRMECSKLVRDIMTDICFLEKGQNYTLEADFTPGNRVEDVESRVAWKSWLEMPLPDQETDACDGHLTCPLDAKTATTFTYSLHIKNFWMRRRYPIVWRLKDDDRDQLILCFTFMMQIE